MIDEAKIVEYDSEGWSVQCPCGETTFVGCGRMTEPFECERCGTTMYLEATMDVYVAQRKYRDAEAQT
jgi:hypothetical protein